MTGRKDERMKGRRMKGRKDEGQRNEKIFEKRKRKRNKGTKE